MAVGKQYEYDAVIHELPEKGGAYVVFPWNIREEFGKGRVKVHVHAAFDGIPYDGSIVNMGVKNEDGSVCYILGMLKSIRSRPKNAIFFICGFTKTAIGSMMEEKTEVILWNVYANS